MPEIGQYLDFSSFDDLSQKVLGRPIRPSEQAYLEHVCYGKGPITLDERVDWIVADIAYDLHQRLIQEAANRG